MSKRNMLLGLATGKVGDLVFYRDGGEQRTRTRVKPKNPRSIRQMTQRVKLANVVNTFRQLRSVIVDSFPNRPSNQSGYNAFAKNAISSSPYLSKSAAVDGLIIPARLAIARGSIQGIEFNTRFSDSFPGMVLPLPGFLADSANVGTISSAILENYPQLSNGDMLTFIMMDLFEVPQSNGSVAFYPTTQIVTFVIDVASTASITDIGLAVEDDGLYLASNTANSNFQCSIVASRVDGNGQLDVSTSYLVLSPAAVAANTAAMTDAERYRAVESYGVGSQSLLREWD